MKSTLHKSRTNYVGFEVFTAVTMKNAVFWDVAPCTSCELNRYIPEDGILQMPIICTMRYLSRYRSNFDLNVIQNSV
jgi:hypothetical protein